VREANRPEPSLPQAAARNAGRGAGLNLAGVGMNVNLAPVLDVFRKPGDFIDRYQRSYSNHPRTVARLGQSEPSSARRGWVRARRSPTRMLRGWRWAARLERPRLLIALRGAWETPIRGPGHSPASSWEQASMQEYS